MGICPCDVLCIACVRVLNGSFSASCLVRGIRTDVLVVVVVVVVETQKMRCWVRVKKRKRMKAWRGSGWHVVENADWIRVGDARGRKTNIASSSRRAVTFRFVACFDGTKTVKHG